MIPRKMTVTTDARQARPADREKPGREVVVTVEKRVERRPASRKAGSRRGR